MILDSYYTTDSAAKFLGVSEVTIRNLTIDGKLTPIKVGQSNVYHRDNLRLCKQHWYADGMTHRDIAEKYGKNRTTVIYQFNRLKVKPSGVDGRRKGQPAAYSPETVDKMAKLIGWDQVDDWKEPAPRFRCPSCGLEIAKNGHEYMEQIDCPDCGEKIRVPV